MTAGAPRKQSTVSDDSGYGLAMFVIFSAAALIVTGAVALLALVELLVDALGRVCGARRDDIGRHLRGASRDQRARCRDFGSRAVVCTG